MNTTSQGALAEEQAARYLEQKGYEVLAQNFRAAGGEIDLVVYQKNTLVFVEVKQRAYDAFGGPVGAVTPTKQKRIAKAATQFVKAPPRLKYEQIRFDVVAILPEKWEHIESAFFPPRTTL